MTTKLSKRMKAAHEGYDRDATFGAHDAINLVKANAKAKFDETVEVAFKLGIDPRKADQGLRGTVSLPAGTGKTVRVAVFAQGDKAREAEEAGADIVGAEDLIERIAGGFMEFDATVATPDLMPKIAKVAKTLGQAKLMPNTKVGTVTTDVGKTVREIKGGKVEYRNDKLGNISLVLGKASFTPEQLLDNFAAVLEELQRAKPSTAKGKYIQSISLSSTMGPGVRVDPNVLPRDIRGEHE